MKIQESGENYLETILLLTQRSRTVRSVDIAGEMGFSKPSVSRAMGLLRNAGMILTDEEGYITLTPLGRARAARIYERHQLLTRCLSALGVTGETAAADACRIEHVISQETFDRLKDYLEAHGL